MAKERSSKVRIGKFRKLVEGGKSIEEAQKQVEGFNDADLERYYKEMAEEFQAKADEIAARRRGENPKKKSTTAPKKESKAGGRRHGSSAPDLAQGTALGNGVRRKIAQMT